MIIEFNGISPQIDDAAYILPGAVLIGKVSIGSGSSIWPNTVLRGDVERIEIGHYSNIQDGSLIHTNYDLPVIIGERVTVGHGVILHGCSIASHCLIGMGSVILDGVRVNSHTIVAAGAVVPENKSLDSGVYMGIPAEKIRDVSDKEKELIKTRSMEYVELAQAYNRQNDKQSDI